MVRGMENWDAYPVVLKTKKSACSEEAKKFDFFRSQLWVTKYSGRYVVLHVLNLKGKIALAGKITAAEVMAGVTT